MLKSTISSQQRPHSVDLGCVCSGGLTPHRPTVPLPVLCHQPRGGMRGERGDGNNSFAPLTAHQPSGMRLQRGKEHSCRWRDWSQLETGILLKVDHGVLEGSASSTNLALHNTKPGWQRISGRGNPFPAFPAQGVTLLLQRMTGLGIDGMGAWMLLAPC